MKSRANLKYITLAQIVGCCLVVLGHSFPFVTPYPLGGVSFVRFLYAFHMPLFVWCSGFLFAYTEQADRKSFGEYVRQRSARLLIPYFVLSLVGILPKILAASVLNDTLEMDATQLVRAFLVPREGIWGHFWFLPMIYLMGIMGYILDKAFGSGKTNWTVVTVVAFGLSFVRKDVLEWFAINDVLHFFIYYSLGVACCRTSMRKMTRVQMAISALGCVTLSVGLFVCINGSVPVVHVRDTAIACLMTASIVSLCKLAEGECNIDRTSPLAQTYQIFILSWPCQLVVGILAERILHFNWMAFIPTVFVAGMALPLVLLRMIDLFEKKTNTQILSFVLGR